MKTGQMAYGVLLGLAAAFSLTASARAQPYYQPAYSWPQAAALAPWQFNFDIGGGPTPVLTGAKNQITSGANFVMGAGYNFTPQTGFVVEYMNSDLGVTDANLQANGAVSGGATVWGVTLNPIYRFRIDGPIGGYIIGGGGYYERDEYFDQPVSFTFINHFGQTVNGTGTERITQTTGAGGVNLGVGMTWNIAHGTKFFSEVRYHCLFTNGTATQILPITFGLRW